MYELVLKGQHITPRNAEVHVKHVHIAAPVQCCTVARVEYSFDDAKIELSTICDVTLREKFKEPTLQLHAKFEAPAPTADEVHMSQLAEISLYCQHHDVTAEKWSHIPKPPFQASGGNENLTSDDPSGVVHDDITGSTDFIRITSPELEMASKPPVLGCVYVESIRSLLSRSTATTKLTSDEPPVVGRDDVIGSTDGYPHHFIPAGYRQL